jgi:hypothetical protein
LNLILTQGSEQSNEFDTPQVFGEFNMCWNRPADGRRNKARHAVGRRGSTRAGALPDRNENGSNAGYGVSGLPIEGGYES